MFKKTMFFLALLAIALLSRVSICRGRISLPEGKETPLYQCTLEKTIEGLENESKMIEKYREKGNPLENKKIWRKFAHGTSYDSCDDCV